jgi:hypothetical protein
MVWAKRGSNVVPRIFSPSTTYEINDYSNGYNSFLSNDKFPFESGKTSMWRLAQNARITTLGEYGTRKGVDFHSSAAGSTQDDAITSTAGAADQSFSTTARIAQVFTSNVSQRLNKIEINIKNASSGTGTVMVEIWTDSSGSPGAMLARSSIAASSLTSSYQYLTARFIEAPEIASSTDYWIVVYVQATGLNSYSWSSTTNETTALTSTDSGVTWSAASFAMNFKEHYSTSGAVIGLHRAYKSDGTKKTLFVQGTTLYSVDDVTGALTTVKSGLNASATKYRFVTVNDIVYYVNEYDGLRKWDFTTESQVSATNYSLIAVHKGFLFLRTTLDPNKVIFSNFADYETFTSTDFIYVPSPKTGDPVVALKPLNGYMLFLTLNNKHILSGDDNATFSLDEAPDQKGTYTQETVDADSNFIYYLSNDGVYRSNGSEAQILSADIYQEIVDLPNKDDACVKVNNGHLYVWYTPSGTVGNSRCYVFSLNYGDNGGTTESIDTNSFVSRAVSGFQDDNVMLVGSSKIGQVYWHEQSSNDYTNLGGDIDFELRTHYIVGVSPAVRKEVRYWEPRFGAQSANYTISAEYSTDLRDNWTTYNEPNVQGAGITYGSGKTYGSGETYGTTAEVQSYLYIPGEYRRIAIRYKHYATRQPHTFLGHTFVVQSRRLR